MSELSAPLQWRTMLPALMVPELDNSSAAQLRASSLVVMRNTSAGRIDSTFSIARPDPIHLTALSELC